MERMENPVIISWQAREFDFRPKEREWFWIVCIIAAGVAVSAFVFGDYLFSVIAILGGFTVMLVGAGKPPRHTYSLTERGFMIGAHLIPYAQMTRFSITEEEPRKLNIETRSFTGTVSAPLADADYRIIRTELKNRNIDEAEHLDKFIDSVARRMGL
jgi:hypothetical protein